MDLKKYNQRILAIIGTLLLGGLIFLMIAGIIEFISNLNWNPRPKRQSGIVIDKNQIIDTTQFSFKQEISLLEPVQLDSAQPIFIIPIGQKDQKEKRKDIAMAGLNFGSSYTDDYSYESYYGLYNNFVFLDYKRELRISIFNSKVAITEWAYMKIDTSRLILFKGTDTDLNEDGRLNSADFQSLFVFNIRTLKIKELRFKNQTVEDFKPLTKTSKIYVWTGKDINNDNKFNSYDEPTDLYFFDVKTGEKEPLVSDEVKKEIQEILSN